MNGESAGPPDRVPFMHLPDLAVRTIGGSVVHASDELFAERENLIKRAAPEFSPGTFGPKGKLYDGWETRRRREPGHDYAIVRLGAPGIIRGVVVDTSFFTGNYPPEISVEAAGAEGYPSPAELDGGAWATIVPRSPVKGDARNAFEVTDGHRYTHVRLSIYPDGGVARLRVHGEVVPDPRYLAGPVDLAAAENGGMVTGCSDMFYSSAANLIQPGRAATMADGWENARRRDGGHDWVTVRLAVPGRLRYAELDTSCFVGNAPGWARLSGRIGPIRERLTRGRLTRGRLTRGRLTRGAQWTPGSRCCPGRGCSPIPGTGSCSAATPSSPRPAWTSTRTAGWPGCGCTAKPIPRRYGRPRPAGSTPSRPPMRRRYWNGPACPGPAPKRSPRPPPAAGTGCPTSSVRSSLPYAER